MKEYVAIDLGTIGTEGITIFGGKSGFRARKLTSNMSVEKSNVATRIESMRKIDVASNVDIIRH